MESLKQLVQSETIKIIFILIIAFAVLLIGPIFFADYPIPDKKHYIALVEFFRGEGAFTEAGAPWRGRILVPLLASIIPLEATISLRIVSILFSLSCIFLYYVILSQLKFKTKERFLGVFIFIIAVPFITIGSAPLTDSAGLFFILFSVYIYYHVKDNTKKFVFIGILVAIGILARETVIFIIPAVLIWEMIDSGLNIKQLIRNIILIGIIPLCSFLLIRIIVPRDLISRSLDFARLIENLTVETFEATTLATIGQLSIIIIIGIFGNFSKILKKSKEIWKLIFAAGVFLIELAYAYLFETIGNRFFWIYFIFGIPFLLYSLSSFEKDTKEIEN